MRSTTCVTASAAWSGRSPSFSARRAPRWWDLVDVARHVIQCTVKPRFLSPRSSLLSPLSPLHTPLSSLLSPHSPFHSRLSSLLSPFSSLNSWVKCHPVTWRAISTRPYEMIFLSATLPNSLEFARWITYLHTHPCHVVYTDHRPTPLQHYAFPKAGTSRYRPATSYD